MITSMTGYGESILKDNGVTIIVKAKSLNSRYLDLRISMPDILSELEPEFSSIVKSFVYRGTISINMELIPDDRTVLNDIYIDDELLSLYLSKLNSVGISTKSLSVRDLIDLPDVISIRPKRDVVKRFRELLCNTLTQALTQMKQMRENEARSLYEDFIRRLDIINDVIVILQKRKDECQGRFFELLKERICNILDDKVEINDDRIVQEAAVLSTKSDPTEELTRLASHILQFREALLEVEPVGSKLKFILQECNREADTIGAKGADLETSNAVIQIKEELERIREQISNVE